VTAVAEAPVTDPIIETVETRYVTATLTTTPASWTITAVSKVRPGRTYSFTVKRCDCREHAQAAYDEAVRKGGYSMFGARRPRPICPLPRNESHGGVKCRDFDHCYNGGHEHRVRSLFDAVVKSYRPTKVGPDQALRRVAPARRITASKSERDGYLNWLRENDPAATSPYAAS
jgi:hypothetical protein